MNYKFHILKRITQALSLAPTIPTNPLALGFTSIIKLLKHNCWYQAVFKFLAVSLEYSMEQGCII